MPPMKPREDTITQNIFGRVAPLPLIDKYQAYQLLDDKWSMISTDLEIIQTEGFAATKQVDPKDLAIAIKGSTQEVAECIFSNISTRARESLQADIEYLHNVRMRDVEAAQQNIVATIRRLEQEQIITISHGGGGDEVIA